jgi:hypothetical protein
VTVSTISGGADTAVEEVAGVKCELPNAITRTSATGAEAGPYQHSSPTMDSWNRV